MLMLGKNFVTKIDFLPVIVVFPGSPPWLRRWREGGRERTETEEGMLLLLLLLLLLLPLGAVSAVGTENDPTVSRLPPPPPPRTQTLPRLWATAPPARLDPPPLPRPPPLLRGGAAGGGDGGGGRGLGGGGGSGCGCCWTKRMCFS